MGAALAGSSMRSVTNGNAGYVGNNNAGTVSTESGMNGPRSEGTVAADVMPSATNQGGGVRPGGVSFRTSPFNHTDEVIQGSSFKG